MVLPMLLLRSRFGWVVVVGLPLSDHCRWSSAAPGLLLLDRRCWTTAAALPPPDRC